MTWDGDKELHVWVIGEPREPRKDPPEEEPEEAADVGATITPTDFGVTGNSAGAAPSPPPTSTELPDKPLDPVARVLLGMARGVGGLALETGEFLGLTAVTFGGYATFRLYAGMWAGYHEQAADGTKMGVVGAINSLNPLYAIAKGGLETYRAVERGDFEAAGEKGVVTAIVTAVTVVGVIQGLGSLGGKPPSGSGAAAGAGGGVPSAYSVAYETTIPKAGTGRYPAHFAAANENLLRAMAADPELAAALRGTLGEGLESSILSPSGRVLGQSPSGWTWHHVPDKPGVLQLVPWSQHAPGSAWQPLLHPNGLGGMKLWGALY